MTSSVMSKKAAEDLLFQSLSEVAAAAKRQGLSDTMIANQFLAEAVCQAFADKERQAEGSLWVSDMIESFTDFIDATKKKVGSLLDKQNADIESLISSVESKKT